MEESPGYLEIGSHPICHSFWSEILRRGGLKNMKALIGRARKTDAGLWSRLASTRDLPTIAFFRAGPLLRRNGPVPGILAAYRPGAIVDKSGRPFRCSFWVPPNPPDRYPIFYIRQQP